MKAPEASEHSRTEEAIAALLTQPTISAAAKSLKVSEVTLWRWMKEPAFREEYRQARREAVSHAIVRVQAAADRAVSTLEAVMEDALTPAPSRVSAARAILDTAIKAVELEDLEARISELEQLAEMNGEKRR